MDVKNGLVAIASEVLGDVQKEAEAIILDAKEEAKKVLQTAKEKADQNYLTLVNEAKGKAEAEKRRITSLTEVAIRNQLLQTKDELVDSAFERALSKLEDFVATEKYRQYLLELIGEAAKKISSKKLVIQVNAKDKAWLTQETLKGLSQKVGVDLEIVRPKRRLLRRLQNTNRRRQSNLRQYNRQSTPRTQTNPSYRSSKNTIREGDDLDAS